MGKKPILSPAMTVSKCQDTCLIFEISKNFETFGIQAMFLLGKYTASHHDNTGAMMISNYSKEEMNQMERLGKLSREELMALSLSDVDLTKVHLLIYEKSKRVNVLTKVNENYFWKNSGIGFVELIKDQETILTYQTNPNHSYTVWYRMSDEFKNDVEFAKKTILLNRTGLDKLVYFSNRVRRNQEVIELCFSQAKLYGVDLHFYSLLADDRLKVSYEICKKYPEYEKRLGMALRRKVGDMGIVKFYEMNFLKKSLNKNLEKKHVPTKKMKI